MAESETQNLPEDPVERVQILVEGALDAMGLEGEIEMNSDDDEIVATVRGDDLGRLIGRHGQTLDALQLVCYRAANVDAGDRRRVTVDAGDYRERQRETLHREADSAAKQAEESSSEVRLEPMSSTERRIVHNRLVEHPGIETYSEGDEPDRYVVVAPLVTD